MVDGVDNELVPAIPREVNPEGRAAVSNVTEADKERTLVGVIYEYLDDWHVLVRVARLQPGELGYEPSRGVCSQYLFSFARGKAPRIHEPTG